MAFETGDWPRSTNTWASGAPQERQHCFVGVSVIEILVDLAKGEGPHVGPRVEGLIPVDGPVEGFAEAPAGCPVEMGAGSRAVDLEQAGFIRMSVRILQPRRAGPPA